MIIASPAYFAHRRVPLNVQDLARHNCIGLRLASSGGVYAWELRHEGRELEMRPHGQVICNGAYQILQAALSGCGIGFLPEDLAGGYVREGRLVSIMEDWCPTFPGLHAYYPSRRHSSRALALVIDALRLKD
jgi:DNA-binding transcriptional LysR family regulator